MQSFKIIKPIHILTPYVRYYWILEDGADVSVSERTLPTGCIQLVFHRGKRLLLVGKKESQPQAFICGQCLNFSDVMSAGKIETMQKVNPKWIKISDEIEKRPKRGLLYNLSHPCGYPQ